MLGDGHRDPVLVLFPAPEKTQIGVFNLQGMFCLSVTIWRILYHAEPWRHQTLWRSLHRRQPGLSYTPGPL
jgi:hypothetical protein